MLPTYKPKRLFTFGCSFTNYYWATWSNILAMYLQPDEYYNFGRMGASNYYISNMIDQADSIYNFGNDDLVVVCWSCLPREDRFVDKRWNEIFNLARGKELAKITSPEDFILRDLHEIKLVNAFLENKTNVIMFSMTDLNSKVDEFLEHKIKKHIQNLYSDTLDKVSFGMTEQIYTHWMDKTENDRKLLGYDHYYDGHPSPFEHYKFLTHLLDHDLDSDSVITVYGIQDEWIKILKYICSKDNRHHFPLSDYADYFERYEHTLKFYLPLPKSNLVLS